MALRILLADDHRLVRENLSAFLEMMEKDVRVFEAGNFKEAEAIASRQPDLDVIILDLMMPGMNGLTGISIMRGLRPDVPLAILSGSTRQEDIRGALDMGAKGFIPKTIGGQALLSVLRLILSGDTYIPPIALSGEREGTGQGPGGSGHGPIDSLTAREKEVLNQLIEGSTNKYIANALGIKEVTVKVHLQNVFRKLEVSNRTEAVSKVLGKGWIRPDNLPS